MSLESLIPTPDLSKTEIDVIAEIYQNPAIAKHLRIMALNDTKELLSLSSLSKSEEEIAKALAKVQGKLEVLSTLLSIAVPQTKE